MPAEILAEVVRSGLVEGHHYGSVVGLDAAGGVLGSIGEVTAPILPRSCNKPLQALGMLELGLDLPPEQLALACASHSGEPMHLEQVHAILAGVGLEESALQCPTDWPLRDNERDRRAAAGEGPTRVLMNCSGKHAAMLATCVVNDWDTETYLDPAHPLQQGIAHTFAEITGEPVEFVAVDGCGAPILSTSLVGLAGAFSRLATATEGPRHQIAEAIRLRPELVSGSDRDERLLLEAIPGAIGKAGAEGCYVVALVDGRAVALKIDDGGVRARPVVMAAALEAWGYLDVAADLEAVRATGSVRLLGGGVPVGEVRPAGALSRPAARG